MLPLLLAISANSPYLDGRDTRPALGADAELHEELPALRRARRVRRLAMPTATTSSFLIETRSIVEFTQVWWSVRPHFSFGTVEVRICDAQATAQESDALAALMVACVAQAARDVDEGVPFADPAPRLIEENMWRAIRYGLDGTADRPGARARSTRPRAAIERLAAWTAPVRAELGIEPSFPERNGAQRQRR